MFNLTDGDSLDSMYTVASNVYTVVAPVVFFIVIIILLMFFVANILH